MSLSTTRELGNVARIGFRSMVVRKNKGKFIMTKVLRWGRNRGARLYLYRRESIVRMVLVRCCVHREISETQLLYSCRGP